MYKEQRKIEESSLHMNNQSFEIKPLATLVDKNSALVDESNGTINSVDDEKTTAQLNLMVHEEEHADDSSAIVDPVTPDLNERSSQALDSNQLNEHEDINESDCNSTDMLSEKRDDLDEAKSIGSKFAVSALGKLTSEVPHDIRDDVTEIKLLKEEVSFVKKKFLLPNFVDSCFLTFLHSILLSLHLLMLSRFLG